MYLQKNKKKSLKKILETPQISSQVKLTIKNENSSPTRMQKGLQRCVVVGGRSLHLPRQYTPSGAL